MQPPIGVTMPHIVLWWFMCLVAHIPPVSNRPQTRNMSLTEISLPNAGEPTFAEEDADQLKDYERVKIVGQGSFGVAVLYRKRQDATLVVLKQIEMSNLTSSEKEMALNEVDVFSKLHHPNIISYLGSFICANVLIIEMEYADGGTLAQIIAERSEDSRFIPERNVVTIFEQITSSIKYMHGENIIHRDLKTANVFLNKKGIVKIGDFGISKMMNTRINTHTVLGTPYYFSPEMCEGSDYNNKSDIWALGCILGEMCCLRKCFAASNLSELVTMIMSANYLPLPEKYSPVLREVMKQLLQVDAKKRPSATDILLNWIPQLYTSLQSYEGYTDTEPLNMQDHPNLELTGNIPETQSTTHLSILSKTDLQHSGIRSIVYQLMKTPNDLSIEPIAFPRIVRILSLSHSATHYIAITSDGFAFVWGESRHGQIGVGPSERISPNAPIRVDHLKQFSLTCACAGHNFSIFVSNCGTIFSCGDNAKGCLGDASATRLFQPKCIAPLKGNRIVQISCGRDHVVAMDSDGNLYSWGSSKFGALGQGDSCHMCKIPSQINLSAFNRRLVIQKVVCGPDCTFLILETGELYACGSNSHNRLGLGRQLIKTSQLSPVGGLQHPVIDVCCSKNMSVALVRGGYVYSMGRNAEGQRGLGHCDRVVEPTMILSMKDHFIMKVKCCDTYCVAYTDKNVAYIWGTRQVKHTTDRSSVNLSQNTNNSSYSATYKRDVILEPMELLALYSSEHLLAQGLSLQFSDIIPQKNCIMAWVDTSAPLG